MKAEILAFEKRFVQLEVEEDGKKKMVEQPFAIITLRSELPKSLPVGKTVDIIVTKEDGS